MTGGVGTGAITYSSGTPSVATVHATTGEVTVGNAGTTVITATKAATPTHAATTASYSVVVVQAPSIQSSIVATNNQYVDITFNQGMYTNANGTGGLTSADFVVAYTKNAGNATGVTVTDVTKPNGTPLNGGETTVRVALAVTGTPNGQETIEVRPVNSTSIYNRNGTALAQNETTGVISINGVYMMLTGIFPSGAVYDYGHGTKGTFFFGGIEANTSYQVSGYLVYSDRITPYESLETATIMGVRSEGNQGSGSVSNFTVHSQLNNFTFTYTSGPLGGGDKFNILINGANTSVFWTN
ncbi:hypothetical protein DV702_16690 [Sporosarcina sp. PTS2304]|uniref:hypothetical protein n=1 Tax=Sporosarcina sp. PTS2304 TaxID=2283194 RepID=UPI000E0DD995|nr:hypothetical protein [Sporosarcina sp. PTS2304]AXI01214.1 hypothetical protein DV702_16690 [Sporosarcina sp. PTS2304]